jgi:hypothetical protein
MKDLIHKINIYNEVTKKLYFVFRILRHALDQISSPDHLRFSYIVVKIINAYIRGFKIFISINISIFTFLELQMSSVQYMTK